MGRALEADVLQTKNLKAYFRSFASSKERSHSPAF